MNSRSRNGFYALWTIAIYIAILLALFTVFFVSCQKAPPSLEEPAELPAGDASAEPPPVIISTPEPVTTLLAQTEDQGTVYQNSFVFLGDVNTHVLAETGALPQHQVWSTENGNLNLADAVESYILFTNPEGSRQESLIYNAAAIAQPQYMVINLGFSGLTYLSEADFKAAYTDLISTIQSASPNTKIVCQSILPVIDTISGEVQNSRIERANGWILEVAEETGTRYLNTAELLVDDTGNLRSEYAASDGVLLSEPGCQAVLYYLRNHGYR